ncbi:MAG: bifunctional adenosylcobinamide kinase/adenosylcobinamide-phosphate guanylyltransferase [Lachnospiraceae bacterium]|nr:bifunctional adenosylcobinamide kinase/adenosylcobinamide-phosphate guanylyltransferase [Lachnospiraceae bacterium]
MLCLITGGSGSGKSEYAEQMVMRLGTMPRLYIATMYPFDEECHGRIRRHRVMRAEKGFETLECYTGLKDADVSGYGTVLLECMSNLVANELYQEGGAGAQCVEAILEGVQKIREQCEHLIVVTNEIFSDGIEYDEKTRQYQQYLGSINRQIASMAEVAAEVVYSIPLVYKGNPEAAG